MKLTEKGKQLICQYLTASNVGTMPTWPDKEEGHRYPLNVDEVRKYWWRAVDNHACEGIELEHGDSEYRAIMADMVQPHLVEDDSYTWKVIREELPWMLEDPKLAVA